MKKLILAIAFLASCDSGDNKHPEQDSGIDTPDPMPKKYKQVEHLGRPAVNEAFLISEGFLGGYNATAPTFAGVPADTLNQVVGEAKTVMKALYLGGCLLNGALGLTAAQGVKPAGITCHAVGPALWVENSLTGVTLTPESKAAAQAYADKVFAQFEPDVLRVDVSAASSYLTLCGDANSKPLLCGGRFVNNDVVDVTYNYVLNGAGTTKGPFDQVRALTGDGVEFSKDDANNVSNVTLPDPANTNQGHVNVSQAFPYSARPF